MSKRMILQAPKGQDVVIEYKPGLTVQLPVDFHQCRYEREGDDLVARYGHGTFIRIRDLFAQNRTLHDMDIFLRDPAQKNYACVDILQALYEAELMPSGHTRAEPLPPLLANAHAGEVDGEFSNNSALHTPATDEPVMSGIATIGLDDPGLDIDTLLPGALRGLIPVGVREMPDIGADYDDETMLPSLEAAYDAPPVTDATKQSSDEAQLALATALREVF